MSWASRRRSAYTLGTILFFAVLIGGPILYWYVRIPETCSDGIKNGDETLTDKGGSCPLLDEHLLSPHAILWTREFSVRLPAPAGQAGGQAGDGTYNVIAYVENPNKDAGVMQAPYRFKLYDARNVLVAEREGVGFIMPGTITPVFEGAIDTGNRKVARAYLEFTAPLVWERVYDATLPIAVESKTISDVSAEPRLMVTVKNTSVADLRNAQFVASIFDTAGNAFAGSSTVIPLLSNGERKEIVFTWPDPFVYVPGRIDVLPVLKPSNKKP